MEFTRESISKVSFTVMKNKFYPMEEVNRFMDELKKAADEAAPKLAEQETMAPRMAAQEETITELEKKITDCEIQMEKIAAEYEAQLADCKAKIADYEAREKSIASAIISSEAAAADILTKAEEDKSAILAEAQFEKARLDAGNRQMREDIVRFRRDILIAINGLNQWFEDALSAPRGPLAIGKEEANYNVVEAEAPAEEAPVPVAEEEGAQI